jgi:FKBP-type peptidyl-prolyl cis-trans isomerase (trigger factor)
LPPSNASENCFLPEEVERAGARRVYRVSISGETVSARVAERLNQIGKTVRLPGFRPGKIPMAVLEQRYGAKARAEAIQALGAQAADQALARGELAATLELSGDRADGVEFRLEVTCLAELADIDFETIEIERLSASRSELDRLGLTTESAEKLFDDHRRRMVLDSLDKAYRFPIAPQLIAADYTTPAEREAIEAELGAIAERRVRLGAVVAEMARRQEIRLPEEEILRERRGGEAPAQTGDRLREDKLIRLVMSKARVTDREATAEELRELVDAAG